MTTITFDPLRIITEAQDELITKAHLDSVIEKSLAPVRTDLAVLRWMIGVLLAGVLSLILKAFF